MLKFRITFVPVENYMTSASHLDAVLDYPANFIFHFLGGPTLKRHKWPVDNKILI